MLLGAYGSSNINIGLSVHLRDNFSGPAAQVKAAFGGLKQELNLYQENLRNARNLYGQLFAIGGMATAGMVNWVREGAKFDYTIRGVAAATGATKQEFKQLFDMANKLGGVTMFAPQEIGQAMRELGLANFDPKGVLEATPAILDLAGASMTNLATSAQIAINTMYQFNKTARDMGQITDVLTYASNKSAINLTDLGESLKYVSATGVDLGQQLPDVLATLMVLGNAGLKGSIAGVGLENMMRYMALGMGQFAKTGRSKAWESVGLDPKKLVTKEGNLKPLPDIFTALSNALQGMGDVDKQNILYSLFNVRGKRGASKLLQQMGQWGKYRQALSNVEANPGFAKQIRELMMGGPEGDIARLTGVWQSFKNEFTLAISPLIKAVTTLLRGITEVMRMLSHSFVGKVFLAWAAGAIVLKTVIWGVKFAISSVALAQSHLRGTWEGLHTSMLMGWHQLTSAAIRYQNVANAINFQAMARNRGRNLAMLGLTASQAASIPWATGYFMGGGGRVFNRNSLGGVTRVASGAIATNLRPVGFGAGAGRTMFAAGLTTAAAAGGLTGTITKASSILGKVGKVAAGLFGGPWGLAAFAALTALPLIIQKFSSSSDKNTEAVSQNTEAQLKTSEDLRGAVAAFSDQLGMGTSNIRKLYRVSGESNQEAMDFMMNQRLQYYLRNPRSYGDRPFYDMSHKGEINIYYDGKLKDTIEQELNKKVNVILGN